MKDSYLHKGLRKKLVEQLREKGISSEAVLDAINTVPRHRFMDSSFVKFSYSDQAFPIGSGQTISQPFTVAFQTQLLEVKPRCKVLEVGTGSGYQTAVLLELGARVYTIERQRELFLKSQSVLSELGYKAHYFYGDGYEGVQAFAPYDRILVTAGAPDIPRKLYDQMAVGSIMVIPVGGSAGQKMIRVFREEDGTFTETEHGNFAFVPLLKGKT